MRVEESNVNERVASGGNVRFGRVEDRLLRVDCCTIPGLFQMIKWLKSRPAAASQRTFVLVLDGLASEREQGIYDRCRLPLILHPREAVSNCRLA